MTTATQISQLSRGNVIATPPSGPVFAAPTQPRRQLSPSTFVATLSTRDRIAVALLTAGWVAAVIWFWSWWLEGQHRVSAFGTVINSALLLYLVQQSIYFIVAANRLRRVNPALTIPMLRVAFVVTHAPAEPWPLAQETLTAMLAQDFPYPYDVWLCDERTTPAVRRWCDEHGVQVSTREGVEDYHRPTWPRRTQCKEGNLAYFYDQVGYRDYDVVVQLDCDHIPDPTHLAEMVRPFADPAIGYVAAPSMCDANMDMSWSARGRVVWEGSFHGTSQLGQNDGLAPVCIGSHYAVRTAALAEIGGIGPELAEDFTTAFLFNSAGWHGAFAIDAEAHGDGPLTFGDMITQEFQWSRSLTVVLLKLLPRHLGRMGWWLRMRFLYALLHYVLLAVVMVGGLLLPPIAVISDTPWMRVSYPEFLAQWWFVSVWVLALAWLLKRRGLRRPADAAILSWETLLYALSRWPYIAWGVFAAVVEQVRRRAVSFRVTPKELVGPTRLKPAVIAPFVGISVLTSTAALTGELRHTSTVGYVLLCLIASLTYLVVAFAVCVLHAREASRRVGLPLANVIGATVGDALMLAIWTIPIAVASAALFPGYAIEALGW